jgi:hypothetical protein
LKNGRCDREIVGKIFGEREIVMRNDNKKKKEMVSSKVSFFFFLLMQGVFYTFK